MNNNARAAGKRFNLNAFLFTLSVFPSDTALLKALYLATFDATKKWTMPLRNWGKVYGELSIMYDGRLFQHKFSAMYKGIIHAILQA